MPVYEYYVSKFFEIQRQITWLADFVASLEPVSHPKLYQHIKNECEELQRNFTKFSLLLQINQPGYFPRIRYFLLLIESTLNRITLLLLPPLIKEGVRERELAPFLLRLCNECGHYIPTDCIVQVGHTPAVIPVVQESPIFHLPLDISNSLRWWPAFFHEVGHLIVRTDRDRIMRVLISVVNRCIKNEMDNVGAIAADARKEKIKALKLAQQYWISNDLRLEELFCDCFAAYTGGLSFVYFWLDYCIRSVASPNEIRLHDEHPPCAARFVASWNSLHPNLRASLDGQRIWRLWGEYLARTTPPQNLDSLLVEYDLACSNNLLTELANTSVTLIENFPSKPVYYSTIQNTSTDSLPVRIADMLNKAVSLLLENPARYSAFEEQAVSVEIG